MFFSYRLVEPGWARAEFSGDSKTLVYEPAYINDPYGDILRSVCGFMNEDEDGAKSADITWEITPLRITIHLACSEQRIHITITEFDESESVPKKTVTMDEYIGAEIFAANILASGKKMLHTHGLSGYRAYSINYEFPLSSFIALTQKVQQQLPADISRSSDSCNAGCFAREIEVLSTMTRGLTEKA